MPTRASASVHAPRGAFFACLAALIGALVVAVPAPPAHAADGPDCLPAGGVDLPFETPEGFDTTGVDLVVNGGGFGHGVGMSQYGAKGAALAGCTYETILKTYYPGTQVQPWASPDEVRIGLRQTGVLDDHVYVITSASAGGTDVAWHTCHYTAETCDGAAVAIQRAADTADAQWHVRADVAANVWVLERHSGDTVTEIWRGGNLVEDVLQARHEGTVTRYSPANYRNKWGYTQFDLQSLDTGPRIYVTEHITAGTDPHTGDTGSAVDRYLWGLDEVPLKWPAESLKTQAVAGRSYALAKVALAAAVGGRDGFPECRCDLRPTTVDQHWTGFTHELTDRNAGHPWRKAVEATADLVSTYDDPARDGPPVIVQTFYSSSHGGYSEDVKHVWGTAFPYLTSVDTSRWECLGDNPYQRWSVGFSKAQLAQRFGLASVDDVRVQHRGPGGRPTTLDVDGDGKRPDGVIVTGKDGAGATVQKRYSTESIRSSKSGLGLRSGLIHLDWVADGVQSSSQPAVDSCEATVQDAPQRVAGAGRVETAAEAARLGWDTSDVVVIARADQPADALAGSGLAGKLDAPLIITWSTELAAAAEKVVNELGATKAVLLGGPGAISSDVEQALLDRTTVETVQRIAGATRYHTAIDIGTQLAPAAGGAAFLVRGVFAGAPEREWPDALAVSGLAAHRAKDGAPVPVLLTDATLPQVTKDALAAFGTKTVHIVGGEAIVPKAVEDELKQLGYTVERIAGEDRYGTSRAVLSREVATAPLLVLATALNFPDGLAAGPLAAKLDGRLLLVPSTYDPAGSPWLEGQHPDAVAALGWSDGQVLSVGGKSAVSDDVARAILEALNGG